MSFIYHKEISICGLHFIVLYLKLYYYSLFAYCFCMLCMYFECDLLSSVYPLHALVMNAMKNKWSQHSKINQCLTMPIQQPKCDWCTHIAVNFKLNRQGRSDVSLKNFNFINFHLFRSFSLNKIIVGDWGFHMGDFPGCIM